jgi:hypothetical protein
MDGMAGHAPSIDIVLEQFLAEQREKLAPRTIARYEEVIELLRHCLNGYAYQSLYGLEKKRWEKAFEDGDEEAFSKLFGPEKIIENYGEFLGYFMIRKVMASQELLKASGTVTKKLAKWLAERGLVTDDDSAVAVERATEASVDLPKAEKLSSLLYEQTRSVPRFNPDDIADEDWVEDYLMIDRVEPDALWLEGEVGPVIVPGVGRIATAGWSVNIVMARLEGVWRVVEVGNVYP